MRNAKTKTPAVYFKAKYCILPCIKVIRRGSLAPRGRYDTACCLNCTANTHLDVSVDSTESYTMYVTHTIVDRRTITLKTLAFYTMRASLRIDGHMLQSTLHESPTAEHSQP